MIIFQILMIPLVMLILLGIVIISLTAGTGSQDYDNHNDQPVIDTKTSITKESSTYASLESQLQLFKIAYPLSDKPASDGTPAALPAEFDYENFFNMMEVEQ